MGGSANRTDADSDRGVESETLLSNGSETDVHATPSPLTLSQTVSPHNVPPRVVQFLFCCTYFFAIIGLNTPQSMYPSMQGDRIFTVSDSADILGIQTLGTMSGKLFAGIFVDKVGSRKAYMLSVTGLSICLVGMSSVSNKWLTAFVAFFVELLFTPIYPSHARFITMWYAPSFLSRGYWLLATTSRGGNIISGFIFSGFLKFMTWRHVFLVSSALVLVGGLAAFFQWDSPKSQTVVNPGSKFECRNVVSSIRNGGALFWLAVTSYTLNNVVKRMGEIVGVFLAEQCESVVSVDEIPFYASSFQAGIFVSVSIVGYWFSGFASTTKVKLIAIMNTCGVIASGLLTVFSYENACSNKGSLMYLNVLFFIIAFSVGISFYILPGTYCSQLGGVKKTGTVNALLDVIGSAGVAFMFFIVRIVLQSQFKWCGVWSIVAGVAVINVIVTGKFSAHVWKQ
eukprot:g1783.t1